MSLKDSLKSPWKVTPVAAAAGGLLHKDLPRPLVAPFDQARQGSPAETGTVTISEQARALLRAEEAGECVEFVGPETDKATAYRTIAGMTRGEP